MRGPCGTHTPQMCIPKSGKHGDISSLNLININQKNKVFAKTT